MLALWHARNLEFVRDRASFSWNIAFPLLLVLGLSLAFSQGQPDQYRVGLITATTAQQPNVFSDFSQLKHIEFVTYPQTEQALTISSTWLSTRACNVTGLIRSRLKDIYSKLF